MKTKRKKMMNKNERIEWEKHFETLSKFGILDKLIESGGIKLFQSREEMNEFMKSKNIKDESVLTIGGDEGRRIVRKVGRNQKCICGSGLKYKKCCLMNNQYGVG